MRPCKRTKTRPGVPIPPDPERSTSAKSKIWDVFAQVSLSKSKIWTPPRTASQGRAVQMRLIGIVIRFCSNDFLAFRTAAHTPHIYAVGSLKSGPILRELIAPILRISIPKNHRNPTVCSRNLSFYTI